MLVARFWRVYTVCDKYIVRNLRGNSISQPKGNFGNNPGLDKRINAFKKEGVLITDENAEEVVDQSDTDFYQVGEAYNEHLNETLMGKYELKHRIIKEKYFKGNMPNLLTWSEKEQIRHLAQEDPQEWTPEKIAESFPVTVPVVKKLLKYPWKPATEERIARHDASVMRNWRELKEESIDIPKDLREHFLKFSNRTIPPLSSKSIKIDLTLQQKMGEFERIVRRCAAQENSQNASSTENEKAFQPNASPKTKLNKSDKKHLTLDELATRVRKRLDSGKEVDIADKMIIDTVNEREKSVESIRTADIELPSVESKEKTVQVFEDEMKNDREIMKYPERIRIPKKAYKKGATYKVNDCYYDHDGRFLYRVLGMTKLI